MTAATRLALGAAQWGLDYGIANRTGRPDDGAVAEILALARAAGVDTIDTAAAYGDSEAVIGRLVGDDAYWKVGTKLAADLFAPGRSPAEVAAAARASLGRSLERLGRAAVDSVLLHRWTDDAQALDAALTALSEARAAEKTARVGVSVLTPAELTSAVADPRIDQLQCPAHLLDDRFLPAPTGRVVVHTRSAFFQGVAFLNPEALPAHLEPARATLAALHALAAELGASAAAVWLAYALSLPSARVVVGCERPEQLAANLEALRHAPEVAAAVCEFAQTRARLPDAVLDPWRWPPRR